MSAMSPTKRAGATETPNIDLDEFGYEEREFALLLRFGEDRTKKLIHKIDWRLMPALSVLYLVSYMDRTNIGNARLLGLERDLNLSPSQFNMALTIFFIPYSLFEVPSNIMLKLLRPSVWISLIMVLWGLTTMCTGWVENYSGLLVARFFLGVAEAGLFPGANYITTTWYKRDELQFRMSIFYCAASLAGSFSGLLAYGIGFMDGIMGYSGWKWVFILEGILTVVVAAISYFVLCDTPSDVSWLTEEERRFVILRLQFDGHTGSEGNMEGSFKLAYLRQAFTDSKVYIEAQAQLLTVPIYVWACILCLVNGYSADHFLLRSPHLLWAFTSILVGTAIALCVSPIDKPGVQLFAMFLMAGGLFANTPTFCAWLANNLQGEWKRACGMALQFTIGNLFGGLVGSNIFLAREKPYYGTAYKFEISMWCAGIVTVLLQAYLLDRANKKKAAAIARAEEEGRDLYDKYKDAGDKSPYFKYTM
ncbi:hypothetical protein ASPSYDRAFT_81150 [Aspergillus sydowii CBS 593.65]|uniref:Major facilitator superfamily (MFS) profile domain-containing protein n=1 Tax=Aspergillus sydowii CBS 593.65 TaxID=1036612 RepID=A0A1L9T658_9EURO|nr:uncharacterized protein ASPSYDRAFT_81150 [Aspergillus sydowii CBS 593.65]OJJ54888.1 hypothetical protein ASPSYDRAFT_81150 [Aspergillus sydowii CBS 593.65]